MNENKKTKTKRKTSTEEWQEHQEAISLSSM